MYKVDICLSQACHSVMLENKAIRFTQDQLIMMVSVTRPSSVTELTFHQCALFQATRPHMLLLDVARTETPTYNPVNACTTPADKAAPSMQRP